MGPHKYNMAPRLLVLIALAAYCQALPAATDAVVPEGMMMQVAFSSMTPTAFISAMTKSGGSKADCGTFASPTVSDIGTAVSSQQTVLDALDNGRGCAALGQTLVTSTQAAVVSAQADVVTKQGLASDALAAKTAACSASVEFDVNLDALANSCYDYTSEASFTQAEAACDSATSASTAADADVVIAQTVVTDAQDTAAAAVAEASRLESGCLCRVHKEQTAAWTAATTAHATHVADWKQANEILCALDSATTSCNFDACPAVTKPTVATGAENADSQHCTPEPTTAPTQAPTKTPTQAPTKAPTKSPVCSNVDYGHCRHSGVRNWVGVRIVDPGCSGGSKGGCSGMSNVWGERPCSWTSSWRCV